MFNRPLTKNMALRCKEGFYTQTLWGIGMRVPGITGVEPLVKVKSNIFWTFQTYTFRHVDFLLMGYLTYITALNLLEDVPSD